MSTFSGFSLTFHSMSLKIASQMNISSIFTSAFGLSGVALLFDAIAVTDEKTLVSMPSGFRYWRRRGTGLRIAMSATNIQQTVGLTFAAVAAQATLCQANAAYQVEGIGLDPNTVCAILDLPLTAAITADSFSTMQRLVSETLPAYLEGAVVSTGQYIEPCLEVADDPLTRAHSINYAMGKISQGASLKNALASLPENSICDIVLVTYSQLLGSADPSITPTASQIAAAAVKANAWLTSGQIPTVS